MKCRKYGLRLGKVANGHQRLGLDAIRLNFLHFDYAKLAFSANPWPRCWLGWTVEVQSEGCLLSNLLECVRKGLIAGIAIAGVLSEAPIDYATRPKVLLR